MYNLLKADLYRLSRTKSLYFLLFLFIIIIFPILNDSVTVVSIPDDAPIIFQENLDEVHIENNIVDTMVILFLLSPFAILQATLDIKMNTTKNVLAAGVNRKTYLLEKNLFGFLVLTIFVVIYFLLSTIWIHFYSTTLSFSYFYTYKNILLILIKILILFLTTFIGVSIAFLTNIRSISSAIGLLILLVTGILTNNPSFEWAIPFNIYVLFLTSPELHILTSHIMSYLLQTCILFIFVFFISYTSFSKKNIK